MPPLKPVPHVDVDKYMGTWHVIANIDNFFERGVVASTETYTRRPDGKIDIMYRGHKGSADGPEKTLPQTGWVDNVDTGSEWRVRPFWPLSFAYVIIDLADDYSYSVVGYPSRKLVWIMARDTQLPAATYDAILDRLKEQGYDLSQIQKVPQN